ncbi:MAG: ATP-binding cassette domain-containing protein [Alphaproteobacteria bacterium]|nr:ATP-binding cassette domain-containing protein [Alphaproteobacteria bacterium]
MARAQDDFSATALRLGGSFGEQAEAVEKLGVIGDPRALPMLQALSDGKLARMPDDVFDLFPILKNFLKRRGGDLSGGQQQLPIARALTARPRLLILDEPTEGIQPNVIKDIARVIALLAKQRGMGVILVEQYFDFARELADSISVMVRGEVALAGATADLPRENVLKLLTV